MIEVSDWSYDNCWTAGVFTDKVECAYCSGGRYEARIHEYDTDGYAPGKHWYCCELDGN